MKKLLAYLKQIDPRITVEVDIEGSIYVISASIENEFSCASHSPDFRKAKKQFFKGPITLAIAEEVASLRSRDNLIRAEKERVEREMEEMLAKEFEIMLEQAAEVDELQALMEYVEKHNEIRSKVDHMRGLK